ncbi:MAG: serine hydrolase domain-containing protein, partial [Betaproteobacteria bacterium]
MKTLVTAMLSFGLAWTATSARALEPSSLDALGLSAHQMKILKAELERRTLAKEIPGAVFLVAKDGKIGGIEAVGLQNPLKGTPMQEDSIFRIASMTKPIVSVAAMMLVERGRLALRDPVAKYLPEFQNLRVAVEERDADGKTSIRYKPARTTMTVHDLFGHTAGLTSGNLDNSYVDRLMVESGI